MRGTIPGTLGAPLGPAGEGEKAANHLEIRPLQDRGQQLREDCSRDCREKHKHCGQVWPCGRLLGPESRPTFRFKFRMPNVSIITDFGHLKAFSQTTAINPGCFSKKDLGFPRPLTYIFKRQEHTHRAT